MIKDSIVPKNILANALVQIAFYVLENNPIEECWVDIMDGDGMWELNIYHTITHDGRERLTASLYHNKDHIKLIRILDYVPAWRKT